VQLTVSVPSHITESHIKKVLYPLYARNMAIHAKNNNEYIIDIKDATQSTQHVRQSVSQALKDGYDISSKVIIRTETLSQLQGNQLFIYAVTLVILSIISSCMYIAIKMRSFVPFVYVSLDFLSSIVIIAMGWIFLYKEISVHTLGYGSFILFVFLYIALNSFESIEQSIQDYSFMSLDRMIHRIRPRYTFLYSILFYIVGFVALICASTYMYEIPSLFLVSVISFSLYVCYMFKTEVLHRWYIRYIYQRDQTIVY
jgi:hypothetical protein